MQETPCRETVKLTYYLVAIDILILADYTFCSLHLKPKFREAQATLVVYNILANCVDNFWVKAANWHIIFQKNEDTFRYANLRSSQTNAPFCIHDLSHLCDELLALF